MSTYSNSLKKRPNFKNLIPLLNQIFTLDVYIQHKLTKQQFQFLGCENKKINPWLSFKSVDSGLIWHFNPDDESLSEALGVIIR